jgi:hypothetical protein
MGSLDILDLFRAGCASSSWYATYSDVRRVRIPITDTGTQPRACSTWPAATTTTAPPRSTAP